MNYSETQDGLEARYGAVMAEAVRNEIRKADNGGVVYFSVCLDLAVRADEEEAKHPAEFKRAA